jgi:1-acyl-sn-glycerol-3-phosphate acyltransferase
MSSVPADQKPADQGSEPHATSSPLAESAVVSSGYLKRNMIWRTLQPPVALFCRLWMRLKVYGLENIDPNRGGLLLINHQSYLDPVFAAVLMDRPVSYLARDSLFRVPVLGWLLRRTYVIPISRESVRAGSIREAADRLHQGFLVGIFPEGTRTSGDSVRVFRPGFLAVVRRTNQPIYPVAIAGADDVMPRGAWFIRPRPVRIIYGPPLTDDQVQKLIAGTDDRECAEMARQRVAEYHQQALKMIGRVSAH